MTRGIAAQAGSALYGGIAEIVLPMAAKKKATKQMLLLARYHHPARKRSNSALRVAGFAVPAFR